MAQIDGHFDLLPADDLIHVDPREAHECRHGRRLAGLLLQAQQDGKSHLAQIEVAQGAGAEGRRGRPQTVGAAGFVKDDELSRRERAQDAVHDGLAQVKPARGFAHAQGGRPAGEEQQHVGRAGDRLGP